MKLSPEDISNWLSRFVMFNDAVVRSWHIKSESGFSSFEVTIEAKDSESEAGWSILKLRLNNCHSLNFNRSDRINYDVLSNGLHVFYQNELFAFEFGDFVDSPNCLSDIIGSSCYVVAQEVEWSIS